MTGIKGRNYILVHSIFQRSKSSTKDIKDNQLALKEELKLDLSTLDDYIEDDGKLHLITFFFI